MHLTGGGLLIRKNTQIKIPNKRQQNNILILLVRQVHQEHNNLDTLDIFVSLMAESSLGPMYV